MVNAPELHIEEQRQEGFARWMKRPETKLLLSLLPPASTDVQRDCLQDLLESAWTTGYDAGQGGVAALMLARMAADRGPPR